MTKLEAINEILFMINESFINSMDDMSPEAQDVEILIDMVTREICVDEQPFNILPYDFKPDINGEITFSSEILAVEVISGKNNYRVINKRLFNIANKTYKFNNTVSCEAKILFKFEEVEDIVQNYIIKKAAYKKVAVDLGNKDLAQIAREEMFKSRSDYIEYNINLVDGNFLDTPINSLFKRHYDIID